MEVRPVKQNIIKEQERNRHQFYPVNTEAAAEEKHICATDKPPTQSKQVSTLQERQVADIRTKPVQRQGARLEQLVTSPLQQERIQTVQNLPALSPARQQAVQDSWHRAAQPLYQALRPQLEALQQIQDPAQRRMTEAALERPFCLLWQEAARRQTGPVVEGLMQQDGGNPSRLLAEAAAGRFYDLLWEEMKGRSAERGGMPGISLLESEVMPRDADGDSAARQGVEHGRLPEKGAGGDGMAELIQQNLRASEQEYLHGSLPTDFNDTRKIGERIKQDDLQKVIENARLNGIQIGVEGNPTGGFENYCGDLTVLYNVIEQATRQLCSELFKKAGGGKIILMYDNILDTSKTGQVVDINTFAMTNGRTIILNKFMYDDSAYLAKQYAKAVAAGHFPKGTDYTCIIAHETGHIIDKNTRGLRKKVVYIVEKAARQEGITMDEYITKNVSIYGAALNCKWDYHELIPELHSMLSSGGIHGIIDLHRKEGVF